MNPFFNRINALTLQGYQDDIALQNVLKQTKKVVLDDVNFKAFPRTPQAYEQKNATDLMMNDLLNDIQIQTMLKNRIPQYRPKKIQSEVTEEMIKDYRQESKKPVEINGKLYKFVPPDLDLDLEEPNPNIITSIPSREEFNRNAGEFLDRKRWDLIRNESDLINLRLRMDKLNDDFDDGLLSYPDWATQKKDLEREVELAIDTINSLSDEIDNVPNIRKHYDELELNNKVELDRVSIANKKKLASYEEALKLRNTGQEVAQQPDESDEDYAKRMLDIGHDTVDPDDVKLDAQLYLYNNLKDKFGEFLEPYKTEGLLNTLVQQEGYEFLQKLKDRWPAVSKKIKETFGTLRRVSQETTIDFLTTEVFEPEKPRSEKERELPNTSTPTAKPTLTDFKKSLSSRELPSSSTLTAKPTLESVKKNIPRELPNTSTLTGKPTLADLRNSLRLNEIDYLERKRDVESSPASIASQKSVKSEKSAQKSEKSEKSAKSNASFVSALTDPSLQDPIQPIKFENWSKQELVAYAKDHNMRGLRGGNPEKMSSSALVSLIKRNQPLTGYGIDPLKTRFEIVDGEIQAGNNNPKLIRDARKLLKEMVAKKMVNLYEAKSHMNYLKKIIKI